MKNVKCLFKMARSKMLTKKLFLVLLVSLFLLGGIASLQAATGLIGDVDENNAVDIVDALKVAMYYVGLNVTNFNEDLADTNCDNSIDITDALLIAQKYVGLYPEPFCNNNPIGISLVEPIERNGRYVLEMTDGRDTMLFECSAENGGRITKLRFNGQEMLSQLSNLQQAGSTFWTSPQSDWNWPPKDAIDTARYSVSVETDRNTIVLTSNIEPSLGVRIIKRFSADLTNMAIALNYTIVNTTRQQRSFAPWEITRVPAGGLTFYPTGNSVYTVPSSMKALPVRNAGGTTWFDHSLSSGMSGSYKIHADGSGGWLAHAANNMVFIKTFNDESPSARAPGEGEIEIYANGVSYAEVEQQGAYQSIPANGEISWKVKWFIRAMPDDADQAVGNQALVDFAASFAGL